MDLRELQLLGGDQHGHWYYAAKVAALLRCLEGRGPRRILDVGAGSGFFSKALLRGADVEAATCVDTGYVEDRDERVEGKRLEFRRQATAEHADVVLLMDVLEHVDDDVALLRHYVESAGTGTRFVVSVPACSWLWSGHDEFLGHRRRYTLGKLLGVVRAAGLEPTAGFYFFGFVFPLAAARRLWRKMLGTDLPTSDLQPHPTWLNGMLRRICLAEVPFAARNRLVGLTAFAVARKPPVEDVQR